MTYDAIIKSIKSRKFAPIYCLFGEEVYFLEKIANLLDSVVLESHERDFNRDVLYGGSIHAGNIAMLCKSFPVMADKRLVIVKEAQSMAKKEWDKLLPYLKAPSPSTVLVMIFKNKSASFGKEGMASCEKEGVVFESKKKYEKDIIEWTRSHIAESGYETETGIAEIIVNQLGANIPLIENELEKIFILLSGTKEKKLTKAIVFDMLNIDKEYNVFELINMLGKRDAPRAHFITHRLSLNTKLNPPIVIINSLFRFFSDISLVYSHKLADANAIKDKMKVNWYAAQDYLQAKNKYSLAQCYNNIGHVLEADLMLKGIIPTEMDEAHILKQLVWKLLA